jgi:hypothetical protein
LDVEEQHAPSIVEHNQAYCRSDTQSPSMEAATFTPIAGLFRTAHACHATIRSAFI